MELGSWKYICLKLMPLFPSGNGFAVYFEFFMNFFPAVSSKTLDVVAPPFSVVSSQPSSSRSTKSTSSAEKNFNVDEYIMVNSRNLSSTLEKLYIWEKKLHEQVKVCTISVRLQIADVYDFPTTLAWNCDLSLPQLTCVIQRTLPFA